MKPKDHILKLKQQYPSKSVDPRYLSNALETTLGLGSDQIGQITSEFSSEDYAELLYERLKHRLDNNLESVINEGLIAFGEINNPLPNAYTEETEELNFAIIFNSGLRDFIYRVTRAFSTRISVSSEAGSINAMSLEETCQIIGDIFLWFKETKQACGPSYPITKWQLIVASELASEAESFFLAHELGHVLLRINQHLDNKENVSDQIFDEWHEEFEADRFALSVLIKPAGENYPFATREISYAGAEIGMLIYSGLEKLGFKFNKTHPPAEHRLSAIRENIKKWCADEQTYKQITSLAACNEQMFSLIIDHISNDDYEAFLDRASASIMNEIEDHLDRCTGGAWPDYVSFKAAIFNLFNKGYSHILFERVAKASREFTDRMEQISDSSEKNMKSEAWIAFQKYKLFMSSIMEMHEPAKSIFERALNISK